MNFFCHAEPEPDPEIEARWRKRLAPYYAEASIDPSAIPAGPGPLALRRALVRSD